MSELDELRKEIDALDKVLINTYEKRLNVVKKVGEYKAKNATQVLQQSRENIVIENAINNLENKSYSFEVKELMATILDSSKSMQSLNMTKLIDGVKSEKFDASAKKGFFGEKGSNTEQAMINFFKDENAIQYDSFEDIFKAIKNGEIKYGVVPIENSTAGAITDVYDLLGKYDLYIIAERWERIKHNLFGVKSSSIDQIKTVYSHPQAFLQSSDFLNEMKYEKVPYHNTALSCKYVFDMNDPTKAAIASDRTGKMYNLKLLKEDISSCKDNYTRFIVISSTLLENDDIDKVSIEFSLFSKSGALFNALRSFAKYDINMVKIESRPIKNNPLNYYFYVDLEGNCKNENMQRALRFVKDNSTVFKILGEYKKGEI